MLANDALPVSVHISHNVHRTARAAGTKGHKRLQRVLALLVDLKEMRRKCHGWKPRRPLSPAALMGIGDFPLASFSFFDVLGGGSVSMPLAAAWSPSNSALLAMMFTHKSNESLV